MTNIPSFRDSDAQSLDTLLDWVRWGASRFNQAGLHFGHGTDNAWDEAVYLLSWSIQQPWELFDKTSSARLTESEKESIYSLYTRRIEERIPAPYLTGVAWFAGYPYKVTTDVLVPRSPIAELIAKGFEPWLSAEPQSVLDLCTGSGCIGIACAHQFQHAHVVLSDISTEALAVAVENIDFHQLSDQVDTLQSDGFDNVKDTFDLIVSNPPYVDSEDFASMPAEFQAEPSLALVSGDDGLSFTRNLLRRAAAYLNDGGILVAEVGNSWVALEQAFPEVAFTWPDLENGGHGVFVLTKEQLLSISSV